MHGTSTAAILFLAVVAACASAPHESADGPEFHNPEWSPDGRTIAFESTRDGMSAVFVVSLDGTLRRLTSAAAADSQPVWSRDGKQLFFVSARDGREGIFLMNADGSDQRRLTPPSEQRQYFAPRPSRDGSLVMFASQDGPALYGVGVMNADGGALRQLSDPSLSCEEPGWSSDGEWIVCEQVPALDPLPGETPRDHMHRRRAAKQLIAIRPDGTGSVRAAGRPEVPDSGLSPDGRWSARAACGPDGGIFVTDRAAGIERRLVRARGG